MRSRRVAVWLILWASGAAFAGAPPSLSHGNSVGNGLGSFGVPGASEGISGNLQANIQTDTEAPTFGFRTFTASINASLGYLGVAPLSLFVGFADWRAPAARDVYRSTFLHPEELTETSTTRSAFVAGLSVRLFGDRTSTGTAPVDPARTEARGRRDAEIAELELWLANAVDHGQTNLTAFGEKQARLETLLWEKAREVFRQPSAQLGLLVRPVDLERQSPLEALDLFAAWAHPLGLRGDAQLTVHYLWYAGDPRRIELGAPRLQLALRYDLGETPAPPVLGLDLEATRLYYRARRAADPGTGALTVDRPVVNEVSALALISGAPDRSRGVAAGLGVRGALLWRDGGAVETSLSVVLTSNFALLDP